MEKWIVLLGAVLYLEGVTIVGMDHFGIASVELWLIGVSLPIVLAYIVWILSYTNDKSESYTNDKSESKGHPENLG